MTQNERIESSLRTLIERYIGTYAIKPRNRELYPVYKHWISDLENNANEIPSIFIVNGLRTLLGTNYSYIVSSCIHFGYSIIAPSYKTAYLKSCDSKTLTKCTVKNDVFYIGHGIILDKNKECLMFTTYTLGLNSFTSVNVYFNPKVFLEKNELHKLIKDTIFPILVKIKANPNPWTCSIFNIIVDKENILEDLNLTSSPLEINENRYDLVSKYSDMLVNTILEKNPINLSTATNELIAEE